MYVLCVSNPALAAKSNKPLLLMIVQTPRTKTYKHINTVYKDITAISTQLRTHCRHESKGTDVAMTAAETIEELREITG